MFGSNVQAARLAQDISQQRLAYDTGIDRGQVSSIERGEGNPTFDTILRLATGLGTAPSTLFDGVQGLPPK